MLNITEEIKLMFLNQLKNLIFKIISKMIEEEILALRN